MERQRRKRIFYASAAIAALVWIGLAAYHVHTQYKCYVLTHTNMDEMNQTQIRLASACIKAQ